MAIDKTPADKGGPPEHLRLMLDRIRSGCEVCGVTDWFALPGGGFRCGQCCNVFDVPVIDVPSATEGT